MPTVYVLPVVAFTCYKGRAKDLRQDQGSAEERVLTLWLLKKKFAVLPSKILCLFYHRIVGSH